MRNAKLLTAVRWLAAIAAFAAVSAAGFAAHASDDTTLDGDVTPEGQAPMVTGVGETLFLVVEGAYPTKLGADASLETSQAAFGDLQGFYEDASWNYEPLDGTTFPPGSWLVLTAFRTQWGVDEFADLTEAVGVTGYQVVRARKIAGGFIGLGQEPDPSGEAVLLYPLPDGGTFS